MTVHSALEFDRILRMYNLEPSFLVIFLVKIIGKIIEDWYNCIFLIIGIIIVIDMRLSEIIGNLDIDLIIKITSFTQRRGLAMINS